MPIPLVAGAVVAGAGALGSIIGELFRGKSRAEAESILNQARDEFGRINMPALQRIAAEQLGPSALESVQVDPEYDSAVRGALSRMKGLEDAQGLTTADRAAYNQALNASGRQAAAQRAGTMNAFEARGAGGSGAALASALQGQSDAAARAQQAGLQTAGDAQQRYWQSVRDRFQMGSQASNADYSRKANAAEASDAIARWNATNRQDAAKYNNAQTQQDFDNRLGVAKAKYGLAQQQAARLDDEGNHAGQLGTGIGQAVSQGAAAAFDEYGRRKK